MGRHPCNVAAIHAFLKSPKCTTADLHLHIEMSFSKSRPDAAMMCTGLVDWLGGVYR